MKPDTPKIITGILCILLAACSAKKNSLQRANLNGHVKALTEKEYNAVSQPGGPGKTAYIRRTVFTFNTDGNCTETDGYTPMGTMVMRSVTAFDAHGRKTSQETYDADGRKMNANGYVYDDRGNMTETFLIGGNGENQGKIIFKYDGKDRNIEEKLANGAGEITYRKEQRYNSKGDAAEETEYAPDGSVDHHYTFSYDSFDAKGNYLRKITYKNNAPVLITEREIVYW